MDMEANQRNARWTAKVAFAVPSRGKSSLCRPVAMEAICRTTAVFQSRTHMETTTDETTGDDHGEGLDLDGEVTTYLTTSMDMEATRNQSCARDSPVTPSRNRHPTWRPGRPGRPSVSRSRSQHPGPPHREA
jgi:hypothetical protein